MRDDNKKIKKGINRRMIEALAINNAMNKRRANSAIVDSVKQKFVNDKYKYSFRSIFLSYTHSNLSSYFLKPGSDT